jgi:hypothetical protein
MSDITPSTAHIFNTDIGNVVVQFQEVKGYDVEDVISDKAFSQAQILRFTSIAQDIDVNALQGPRTIKSAYISTEV